MEACALNNLLCYYTENDIFTKVSKTLCLSFVNPKKKSVRELQ